MCMTCHLSMGLPLLRMRTPTAAPVTGPRFLSKNSESIQRENKKIIRHFSKSHVERSGFQCFKYTRDGNAETTYIEEYLAMLRVLPMAIAPKRLASTDKIY